MAKKMGRPISARDDASVKIDRGILGRAQMVAKARKITAAEYLSGILKAQVDRDFLKEMKKLEAEPG